MSYGQITDFARRKRTCSTEAICLKFLIWCSTYQNNAKNYEQLQIVDKEYLIDYFGYIHKICTAYSV